jgi:hypothetical protein
MEELGEWIRVVHGGIGPAPGRCVARKIARLCGISRVPIRRTPRVVVGRGRESSGA